MVLEGSEVDRVVLPLASRQKDRRLGRSKGSATSPGKDLANRGLCRDQRALDLQSRVLFFNLVVGERQVELQVKRQVELQVEL